MLTGSNWTAEVAKGALACFKGEREGQMPCRPDPAVFLRRFIQAMGGSLELVAKFPTGEVRINQIKDIVLGLPSLKCVL